MAKLPVQARRFWWFHAYRMGTTVKYLKSRWKEAQKIIDSYSSWRRRYIAGLKRDTGLTEQQLSMISAIPPKMSGKLAEMRDLDEITAMIKRIKQTRAVWDARRNAGDQSKKIVEQVRHEEREVHELKSAQQVLMARLDAAIAMDEQTWMEFMEIVGEMSDTDIMRFYGLDDGLLFSILKISSPKLMAAKNIIPEEVSAQDNEDRARYFRNMLLAGMGQAVPNTVLKDRVRAKIKVKK